MISTKNLTAEPIQPILSRENRVKLTADIKTPHVDSLLTVSQGETGTIVGHVRRRQEFEGRRQEETGSEGSGNSSQTSFVLKDSACTQGIKGEENLLPPAYCLPRQKPWSG